LSDILQSFLSDPTQRHAKPDADDQHRTFQQNGIHSEWCWFSVIGMSVITAVGFETAQMFGGPLRPLSPETENGSSRSDMTHNNSVL